MVLILLFIISHASAHNGLFPHVSVIFFLNWGLVVIETFFGEFDLIPFDLIISQRFVITFSGTVCHC